MRKEKEKKEKERNIELARRMAGIGLSGRAAEEEKGRCATQRQKEDKAVKKTKKTGSGPARTTVEAEEDREEERLPKRKKQKVVTVPLNTSVAKGKGTKKLKKTNKPKPKGGRKMPVPCDKEGCKHSGLTELREMSTPFLKAYVKKGGWLENMPCKDCAGKPEGQQTDRVMNVADLVNDTDEPKDDLARYCNCGPVAHSMKEGDGFKMGFTCDMILCKGCYRKRVEVDDGIRGETSRRSSRNRNRDSS